MKKVLIVTFAFFVLVGIICACKKDDGNSPFSNCSQESNSQTDDTKTIMDGVSVSVGVYDNKDWDNMQPDTVDDICVPDAITAVSVAKSLMERVQRDLYFPNAVPVDVFFDTEDQIWIVCFSDLLPNEAGEGFNIAIRKDNAEVVKMWVG